MLRLALPPARRTLRRGTGLLRLLRLECLERRELLSVVQSTAAAAGTGPGSILLGPQTGFSDQPYVDIEVFRNGTGLGPYGSEGFGLYPYNHLLLDTGANSVLVVSDAAEELQTNGLPIDGTFLEQGVAGYMELNVSAPCQLNVTGVNGSSSTTVVLPQSADQVRILTDPQTHFGGLPAEFGGIPGLVGMPAMVGRVVSLDLRNWFDATDLLDMQPVGVTFSEGPDALPPGNGHRYSVPLSTPVVFDPQDGLPDGAPPDAPLPVWAPVAFFNGQVRYGDQSYSGNFLLDTGAQISMISTTAAFAIGLDANGDGDFDEEKLYSLPISGVGGTVEVPVLLVDQVRLPTEEGVDLAWGARQPDELGIEVLVLDIADGVDGVIGVDLLTSGVDFDYDPVNPFEFVIEGEPYFEQMHFDFRNLEQGSGYVYFDLNPALDVVTPEPSQPGVVVTQSAGSTAVAEGGATDTFQVVLQSQPASEVTVGLVPDAQLQTDPAQLVFTPGNWDQPQVVTVSAIDDQAVEGPHSGTIAFQVTSADALYDGIAVADLTVSVADNEPQSLGAVAYAEIEGLDPSAGELLFEGRTSQQGFLTLQASFSGPADAVSIDLYDAQGNLLAQSTASDGGQRLDWNAPAGVDFSAHLSGTASNVTLQVVNLVRQEGTSVWAQGTSGNDVFEFDAAGSRIVSINGVAYHFDDAQAVTTTFSGGGGSDKARLLATTSLETARLGPGLVELEGAGYRVSVEQVGEVSIDGRGGGDRAEFRDSAGDDTLEAGPSGPNSALYDAAVWGTVGGVPFHNSVKGFSQVDATAGAGNDTARLYGDNTTAGSLSVTTGYSSLVLPAAFNVRAFRFENVEAHAGASGLDSARVWTADGDNRLEGTPQQLQLTVGDPVGTNVPLQSLVLSGFGAVVIRSGSGSDTVQLSDGGPGSSDMFACRAAGSVAVLAGASRTLWMLGFERFEVTASDEADKAYLLGHDGPETFTYYAAPSDPSQKTQLAGTAPDGRETSATVEGFGHVYAYAGSGGHDVARFYDSPDSADRFWAGPNWASVQGPAFVARAAGFDAYEGYLSGGGSGDTATLYDSAATADRLESHPDNARLVYAGDPNRYSYVQGHRWLKSYASGSPAGIDEAILYLPAGTDQQVRASFSNPQVTATGSGYYVHVKRFGQTVVHGNPADNDTATVWDSSGDEFLAADGAVQSNLATITGADFTLELWDLAYIHAIASQGGDDTKDVANETLLDFVLETTGTWRDV